MKLRAHTSADCDGRAHVRLEFHSPTLTGSVGGTLEYDDPAEALQDACSFVEAALEAVRATQRAGHR